MSTNSEILRKADLAVSDLEADGGKLNAEQTSAFIRKLIEQPTMLRNARTVQMNASEREINKIGFGSRILRPAVSNTPLSAADRAKPTTEQIKLTTKEVIAEINLPYDVIEDNIERARVDENVSAGPGGVSGGIKDTIMTLIAERAALDLEELAISGDSASGDAYLALADGWLKLANVNTLDALAAPISKGLFKGGLKAMPSQYLRNRPAMGHFVSVDNETEYRDTLSNRETGMGDSVLAGNNAVFGFGVPVVPVALMPETEGLFTQAQNLIWGVQRSVSIETDKDIRARSFIIVLTARVDFKLEEPDAVVRYTNIG
mgnify:CR=1 FL=1